MARMTRGHATALLDGTMLAVLLLGCDTGTSVVWDKHVPSPAPEAVENQPAFGSCG